MITGPAESSNVDTAATEPTVSSETKSGSADDSNVWTKPLPVTEEKSRFAFHSCQPIHVLRVSNAKNLWKQTVMVIKVINNSGSISCRCYKADVSLKYTVLLLDVFLLLTVKKMLHDFVHWSV